MEVPPYYRVLQILPEAEAEVVAAAYRALARKHHPDIGGGDSMLMTELNQAWEVLRDITKRSRYDQDQGIRRPDARPDASSETTGSSVRDMSSVGPLAARRAKTSKASVIDFGRYAGWSLDRLILHDRTYVEWLARAATGLRYRAEISILLGHDRPG